jgi:hypothetical protein
MCTRISHRFYSISGPILDFCALQFTHFAFFAAPILLLVGSLTHTKNFLNSKQPGIRCDSGCILIELCRTLPRTLTIFHAFWMSDIPRLKNGSCLRRQIPHAGICESISGTIIFVPA